MPDSIFPPRVVLHIQKEIARRAEYRASLEQTPPYSGSDDFSKRERADERLMLQTAIKGIYDDVVAVARRHFPTIEVVDNPEVTIANILAALPPPEEVVVKRIYHSND